MFITLNHKSLDVYQSARALVREVYRVTLLLPSDEKFNMVSQLRRASLSVKLNLAEGASRRTEADRKRFFEIARGSVVEIDATIETAFDLNYVQLNNLTEVGALLNKSFAMLSKMIEAKQFHV